jgi:hypothetical protein
MDKEMGIVPPEPEERPTPKSLQRRRDVHDGRFSKPAPPRVNPNMVMRPGEISFKQWLNEEAKRERCSPSTIYNRYYNGKYAHSGFLFRQVNSRIIFVSVLP